MDLGQLQQLLGRRARSFTDQQLLKLAACRMDVQRLRDMTETHLRRILAPTPDDVPNYDPNNDDFDFAWDALQGWQREQAAAPEQAGPSAGAGAAGGGGLAAADIDDIVERAVERAYKRLRAREEEVSVSGVGSEEWAHLQTAAGLRMRTPLKLPSIGAVTAGAFAWSDEPEDQQADRYMPHLKNIVPISSRTSSSLVWFEGGKKNKTLLTVVDREDLLYYKKITGNTDVAIVTEASAAAKIPHTGLCILFELKKKENLTSSSAYQAMCQAVLSSVHSPETKPVVVLTDLQDHWQLHWVDGDQLMTGTCGSRSDALAIIRALASQAKELASPTQPGATSTQTVGSQLPDVLANRQPQLAAAPGVQVDEGLAGLSGLVSDGELRAAHGVALVQQLSRQPALSKFAPPFFMYS